MILTDVDGVLLDWFAGFRRHLENKDIEVKDGDPSDWSMTDWINLPSHKIKKEIEHFNGSYAFRYLPHYVPARSQLQKLHKAGHKIVAVTSCSDDPRVHKMRTENLEALFGPIFDEIHCLPLMGDKTEILSRYPSAYWVEDSLHGAHAGIAAGHRTFLLNKNYNQGTIDHRIERVEDWYEIYERIENTRT